MHREPVSSSKRKATDFPEPDMPVINTTFSIVAKGSESLPVGQRLGETGQSRQGRLMLTDP
jgi:hypothetical protein